MTVYGVARRPVACEPQSLEEQVRAWLEAQSEAAVLWLAADGSVLAASAGALSLLACDDTGMPLPPPRVDLQVAALKGSCRRPCRRLNPAGASIPVEAVTLTLPRGLGYLQWIEDRSDEDALRSGLESLTARHQALTTIAADALVAVDGHLRVVAACSTARRWLAAVNEPDSLALDRLPLERVLRTGATVRDLEVRLDLPNCPRILMVSAGPILGPHPSGLEQPVGVLCILRDGTVAESRSRSALSRDAEIALSRRVLASQEAERGRFARELHDDLGQGLTGLRLLLEQAPDSPAVAAARRCAADLLQRTRTLSLALRPAMLDDLGLTAALDWLAGQLRDQSGRLSSRDPSQAGTGLLTLRITLGEERFPTEVEITAYRVAQEALSNAIRHSGAGEITLTAERDAEALTLTVLDNGAGFDRDFLDQPSTGLRGMQDRAILTGCDLEILSTPGRGCRITLTVPLAADSLVREALP